MSNLLIAYDLAEPRSTKPALVAAIMALGEAWARPLETVWYVRTELAESDVVTLLSPLLGADDGLVVQAAVVPAGLSNASLRWFRPRRTEIDARTEVLSPARANIVALRSTERRETHDRGFAEGTPLRAAS